MAKNAQQFEERPWGTFQVLHELKRSDGSEEFVIKQLTVYPQKRLSYQSHAKRKEHWHVIEGEGLVVLNGEEIAIAPESKIEIPLGAKHRIVNNHPEKILIIIEIGMGEFDENDIVRHEDDYGRTVI